MGANTANSFLISQYFQVMIYLTGVIVLVFFKTVLNFQQQTFLLLLEKGTDWTRNLEGAVLVRFI